MEFALAALWPLGLPARETRLLSKSLPKPRYKWPPSACPPQEGGGLLWNLPL